MTRMVKDEVTPCYLGMEISIPRQEFPYRTVRNNTGNSPWQGRAIRSIRIRQDRVRDRRSAL